MAVPFAVTAGSVFSPGRFYSFINRHIMAAIKSDQSKKIFLKKCDPFLDKHNFCVFKLRPKI